MIQLAQAVSAILSVIALIGLVTAVIWALRRLRGEPASPWLLAPLAALALGLGTLTISSFPFEFSADRQSEVHRELTP